MTDGIDRREFLSRLGVTVGTGLVAGAAAAPLTARPARAQEPARGRIPDSPVKFGHITILSGPGAVLGAASLKGHTLAAEEINAAGGLLGKRKIETITADEAAGLVRQRDTETVDLQLRHVRQRRPWRQVECAAGALVKLAKVGLPVRVFQTEHRRGMRDVLSNVRRCRGLRWHDLRGCLRRRRRDRCEAPSHKRRRVFGWRRVETNRRRRLVLHLRGCG